MRTALKDTPLHTVQDMANWLRSPQRGLSKCIATKTLLTLRTGTAVGDIVLDQIIPAIKALRSIVRPSTMFNDITLSDAVLGPCLTKYFVFSLDGSIAVLTYDFIVQLVYFLVIQSHGEVVYKLVPIPVMPILLSTYLLRRHFNVLRQRLRLDLP